jgi:Tfp pilus assembly protein PilO
MKRPIIIAVALYLSLAIAALLIWPKYKTLNIIKDTIEKQKTEIQNNKDYVDKLGAISAELDGNSEGVSKIDSALPGESSPTDLFNFLQSVASENGLILKEIGMGTSSKLSGNLSDIEEANFSIIVTGTYPAFKNFLSEIERSARLINIENISFVSSSPSTKSPKTGVISFSLEIKTYDFPE